MSLQYSRPQTVAEAVELLEQPGRHAVPLAGGAWLTPRLRTDVDVPGSLAGEVDLVVDLANLPLSYVTGEGEPGNGSLHIGATTRLAVLVDDPLCQALAGGILAEAARRVGPVNVRNSATVGGCVAARGPLLEFTLALIALDARVMTASGSDFGMFAPLSGQLITEVRVPWPAGGVSGGLAQRGAHPRRSTDRCSSSAVSTSGIRVVLGGVAETELVVEAAAAAELDDGSCCPTGRGAAVCRLPRQRRISSGNGADYGAPGGGGGAALTGMLTNSDESSMGRGRCRRRRAAYAGRSTRRSACRPAPG